MVYYILILSKLKIILCFSNLFDNKITHVEPFITEFIHADGKPHKYSRTANKWYKTAEERSRERSKTFPGIAKAMAEQWGKL